MQTPQIFFDDALHAAHLTNGIISYIIKVVDGRYLIHRYFGPALRSWHGGGQPVYYKRGYNTCHDDCTVPNVSFDDFPFEYPARSRGDFRIPAIEVEAGGVCHTQLDFVSWRALDRKPALEGLPATFGAPGETATLEVTLADSAAGLTVRLYYTLFAGLGIVARHQVAENTGNRPLTLRNLQSASLELPAQPWQMLTLYGTHAKEANLQRFPLHHGVQRIESVRGSSSPQHQPFFALAAPDAAADRGLVIGFHMVYSGNFLAQAELDQFGMVRAQIGIHPDGFAWQLEPGEKFTTPEAILNCTAGGLNGLRQSFHTLYLHHLMPPRFAGVERPVLLNSWESMYYDVTLSKIERQAELARQ